LQTFEFATAGRIVFGEGTVREAPAAARSMGSRALVVGGLSTERAAPLISELETAGLSTVHVRISGEPSIELIRENAELARGERCDVVLAIGGGSVIDSGKAIAALLTNRQNVLDYLEVIGHGHPIECAPAPFIAIPTTAGTGSEVTRNAVLGSGVKASLRSALMLPRLAIVDPSLTLSVPRAITATTGLDTLTQLIEPYVSPRANVFTDALCRDAIPRAAAALPHVCEEPGDRAARAEMSWASLCSGLALANAGLGAVHGFAAPIGGMFYAPHGAICAALLPHVMSANIRALRSRDPQSPALARYEEVARMLTRQSDASAEDAAEWIAQLCRRLEIPSLATYRFDQSAIPVVAAGASRASSMKANPIQLSMEELREILSAAL
jgi:alcohol dehydrogenase class IV